MKKGKLIASLLLGSLLPIGMALTISSAKPVTAEPATVNFYANLALSSETVTPANGVTYTSAKRLTGTYTYTFSAEELSGHTGHNLIIALDVKADSHFATAEITADMTTDVAHTFYFSTQWTRVYLPVKAVGLSALKIKTDDQILIADASFEDYGSEDLTGKYNKLGQWLLEDCEEVRLESSALISANPSKDLKLSGNYLYAIGSDKLTIIDVTDAEHPELASELTGIGDSARQLCVTEDGNYVIVTSREAGAFVVDVTDKQNPMIVTIYNSIEFANGMDIVGNIAMIGNRQYGVEIVDISNPAQPKHLCTVDAGGEAQSSTYYDGYIYSGLWGGMALTIVDAHDLYNTSLVSTTPLPGKGDGVKIYKTSDNRVLCFASVSHKASSSATEGGTDVEWDDWSFGQGNGFAIYDVTDPTQVQLLSVTRLDGRFYYQNNDYWDINLAEDGNGHLYAYTVNTRMGVYVFDCTDYTAPKRVLKLTAAEISGTSLGSQGRYVMYPYDDANAPQDSIGAVAIKDGVMFLAASDSGIMMYEDTSLFHEETIPFSATEPETEQPEGYYTFDGTGLQGFRQFQTEGQIYKALSYDGKIFLAAGREGIIVLDENLNRLNTVATRSARGIVKDIQIKNGKLYAAMGEDGLVWYTVSGDQLTYVDSYVYGVIRDFALSKTGKFAAVTYAASSGAILNLETKKSVLTQGVGSQMYSRNCGAVADGRYIGFWSGSSGREYWYDCGADEASTTKPTRVAQEKVTCVMRAGITDYDGQILTINSSNKLVTYPANSGITNTNTRATATTIATLNSNNIGRPSWYRNTLITSNPINRKLTLFNWGDKAHPVVVNYYTPVGNPGEATITEEMVLIPMGYQGLVKFDYASLDFHGDHCVCGGTLTEQAAVSAHTCMTTNPTWLPLDNANWATVITSAGKSEPAYYYLTEDITYGSQVNLTAKQNISLCLNGHTVTYTGTARNFLLNKDNITFNICDCTGEGILTKTQACTTGSGLIQLSIGTLNLYGGTLKAGIATTYGGAIATSAGTTLNMYGGSILNCTANTKQGGGVRNSGTFNMYGGVISGCTSVDGGGNVYQGESSATMNLYGGTISGGKTTSESTTGNNGGGNIYIAAGSFTMTGGTVSDGTVTKGAGKGSYGGNLLIGGNVTANISGGEFIGGVATSNGPNVCAFSSNATVNISGGTFRGTSSSQNGYLYLSNGGASGKETTTTISGDVHFVDTTGNSAKYGIQCGHQYSNINIEGGLFECKSYVSNGDLSVSGGLFRKAVTLGTSNPSTTTLTITGGHYNASYPEANIAEGYYKYTENETIDGRSYTSHVAAGYELFLESGLQNSEITGVANLQGGGLKEAGKSITVTAPQKVGGYEFEGWYDGTTKLSSDYSYTLTNGISESKTLKAVYKFGATTVSYEIVTDGATVLLDGTEGALSGTCPAGTVISLTYTGAKPLSMWVNESNKLVTREAAYVFTIFTDTKLSSYEEVQVVGETQIAFLNENGQVLKTVRAGAALSAADIPEVPARANKTGGAWSKTLEEINAAIADSEVQYLEVVATFETENSTFEKLENVTAPTVEMQEMQVLDQADATKKTLSFGVVRNVPEGYTLVEQGILLSSASMTSDEEAANDMFYGSEKARKYVSTGTTKEGVTYLNLGGITAGATVYARGYLVYRTEGSEVQIVYSEIAKGTTEGISVLNASAAISE